MIILVCGSRTWTDRQLIAAELMEIRSKKGLHLVIHGAARGADRLAGIVAKELGVPVREYPANWDAYGRAAGFIRNEAMVDSKPDLVLAFWDGRSKGTKHTVEYAQKKGIETRIVHPVPR